MKILSVSIGLPGGNQNPMWRRISKIAQLLDTEGHEVHLIHYWDKSFCNSLGRLYAEQISEYKKQNPDQTFITSSSLKILFKHIQTLNKDKYDLIYANTHKASLYSILGKITKKPLVFDIHGGIVEEFMLKEDFSFNPLFLSKYFTMKFVDAINLRFSDKIICVSQRMINNLNNKGISCDKMAYVTNGVDLDFFKPSSDYRAEKLKERLNLTNKLVFGYIGGSQKWQGLDNFIAAAQKIYHKKIAFLIVGGDKDLKAGNLMFVPSVNNNTILDYFSICDILVLPRPHHAATEIAAPTKFGEYAAIGKPILTTDVGDAADYVKKYKCGIVIKNNDIDNIINGINYFKDVSPDELKKMGNNARKLAEDEFDWNKIKYNLIEAISSI